MWQFSKPNLPVAALFFGLLIIACSGIWSVPIYANQDGMPHLYNAFLIREIVGGNQAISQFVSLNPSLIPNLTGHWMLAGLLSVFSPAATTKIFVTLLFGGLAFSAFWLRLQVAGREDYPTAMFLSFAISFNWMWFLGFYNFILGVIGFGLTLGFWWRWRENLHWRRSAFIFLLLLFVFFSHLISFVILSGTLVFLNLANWRAAYFKKTAAATLAAVFLALPFFFNFLILSKSNAGFSPDWGFLKNPLSLSNWILHLRSADPFQLISRRALPFFDVQSPLFGIFSSSLWLLIAFALLAAGTFLVWRRSRPEEKHSAAAWLVPASGLFFLWLAAPNDFGKSHGGFLRERLLLLGFICFVPVFRLADHKILKLTARICLLVLLAFQTLVVWDYARYANGVAHEVWEARNFLGENESFGSIVFNRDGCQFKPIPRSNLTPYVAVGKNTRALDNYELGYYLFPTIASDGEDRLFIYEFRESNTFNFCDPSEQFEAKAARLTRTLENYHEKIDVLLVWGTDPQIEPLIRRWFETAPFFENDRLRLFRRREGIP